MQATPRTRSPQSLQRWLARAVALLAVLFFLIPGTTAQDGAAPGTIPAHRKASNVAVITIRAEIDSVTAKSVARRIRAAERAGADAIVFDIDTPGGEVDAVLRICNAIKRSSIKNTAAWINTDAYSGGAIIALACREMIVNDPANFGDAKPISGGPLGIAPGAIPPDLLKKLLPPLIAEVVDSVRRYNTTFGGYLRDEYLAQAIVADDAELWYVRNKETGVRVCIDREEFELLFPGESTGGQTRLASLPGARRAAPLAVSPHPGSVAPAGSPKLAAVAPEVENRQTLPSSRPRFSAADTGKWELLDKITDGSAAATFKSDDLLYFGLAANNTSIAPDGRTVLIPISSDAELQRFLGASYIVRLDRTWSEALVLFMTNIVVRFTLVVVFIIALVIEMTHPGAFAPGLVAALALLGLLAPPMLIGLASWWEIAAILVGIVLLAVELLILPGFGVPGVLGILLLAAGLVGTFVPRGAGFFPNTPQAQEDLLTGGVTVLLGGATAVVGLWLIAKHFGSLPLLGRLVLKDAGSFDESSEPLLAAMDDAEPPCRIGDTGVALTPLRPAGRVQVNDQVIDAVAEFGYIDAGSNVRIVSMDGVRTGVELVH